MIYSHFAEVQETAMIRYGSGGVKFGIHLNLKSGSESGNDDIYRIDTGAFCDC